MPALALLVVVLTVRRFINNIDIFDAVAVAVADVVGSIIGDFVDILFVLVVVEIVFIVFIIIFVFPPSVIVVVHTAENIITDNDNDNNTRR